MKYDDGNTVLYGEVEAILEKENYHVTNVSVRRTGEGCWMLGNLVDETQSLGLQSG